MTRLRRPGLLILLVAPFFGECLSGSTPPLDLLLPWNLALQAALYGSGALLCREVTRRRGLGFQGLVLLGAAYGVFEEGLADRYWFNHHFWHTSGIGRYSVEWHTGVLLAAHLTVFHCAVSICSSVLVVEWLFPAWRDRAWAGPRWLTVAAVAMFVVVPFLLLDLPRPPLLVLLVPLGAGLLLVAAAFGLPRLARRPSRATRWLGPLGFLCAAAHFVIVYSVPSTGLPWPAGVALALAPVAVGTLLVVRRGVDPYGREGLRVVVGVVAFFVVLDAFVGLGGRYDMTLGACATAWATWRLGRFREVSPATA